MVPAHAPLPTDSNLPFHPDSGSHTSIFISESCVGLNVAATRQNDGRPLKASAPRVPRGGVKPPGATGCASVIVELGSARDFTVSQGSEKRVGTMIRIMKSGSKIFIGPPGVSKCKCHGRRDACERPPRSLRSRLPLTRGRAGEGGRRSLTRHLNGASDIYIERARTPY